MEKIDFLVCLFRVCHFPAFFSIWSANFMSASFSRPLLLLFSPLRWSPTAQSTGMLFSSSVSWAAGDWWRQPGMFEHLRFCFNGFPLWCNVSIRFCCTTVLLMTTGQSMVHYQTNIVICFCNFRAAGVFFPVKNNNDINSSGIFSL